MKWEDEKWDLEVEVEDETDVMLVDVVDVAEAAETALETLPVDAVLAIEIPRVRSTAPITLGAGLVVSGFLGLNKDENHQTSQ